MPIRDAGVDKAAAQAGTTRLPENDQAGLDAVLPPGDERNRQELERAAHGDGAAPDALRADVGRHQSEIDKLTARIDAMEAEMLAKQNVAEDRADAADSVAVNPQHFPAHDLDQDMVDAVAKEAGLLPAQVFDVKPRTGGYRVYTVDSKKLDVEMKQIEPKQNKDEK